GDRDRPALSACAVRPQPRDLWRALRRFSSSLRFDKFLVREDLAVSRAHAQALADAGLLPESDHRALAAAITTVEAAVEAGKFPPEFAPGSEPEDIHSAIEARLVELRGDA